MEKVPVLLAALWGANSGFVPELPVVPKGVVGLQSVVGGADVSIYGVRASAVSVIRATVFLDVYSEETLRESLHVRWES